MKVFELYNVRLVYSRSEINNILLTTPALLYHTTAQGTQNPRLGALPVSSPVECCNLGLLPARLGDICVRGRELAGVNCQGHPLTI